MRDHRPRYRHEHTLWWTLSLPLLLFLLLPLLALLLRSSPAQVWANLQRPVVTQAIQVSLRSTALATGLTVLLGTPVSYLLARRTFPGKHLLDALLDMPTVLPPAVAGVGMKDAPSSAIR